MSVHFDTLSLGDFFVLGGRVYVKTDDSQCKRLVDGRTDPAAVAGFTAVEPLKLVRTFIYPPIPVRSFDWNIHLEDYDGAPDAGWQPTGYGATEHEALIDFAADYEDHLVEGEDA